MVQRPADDLAAEGVQHHRQIDEGPLQSDVGDVRHPQTIGRHRDHVARQIRIDPPAVVGVGGRRHVGLLPQAQQVVLAHDPQHPLGIGLPALAPEQRPDAAVTVVPVGQGQPLDGVAQRHLLLVGLRLRPASVEARPADVRQPTQPLDPSFALRAGHRLDLGEDLVAPGSSLAGRDPLKRRKAR